MLFLKIAKYIPWYLVVLLSAPYIPGRSYLTLLEPQSRFGDKLLEI